MGDGKWFGMSQRFSSKGWGCCRQPGRERVSKKNKLWPFCANTLCKKKERENGWSGLVRSVVKSKTP